MMGKKKRGANKHGQWRRRQDRDVWASWKCTLKLKPGGEEAASHETFEVNIVQGRIFACLKKLEVYEELKASGQGKRVTGCIQVWRECRKAYHASP